MVLLKESSRSVLQKLLLEISEINRKTPEWKCLFKNFSSLRPAALLKRDSSTGFFSRICEIFQNTNYRFGYRTLCKKVFQKILQNSQQNSCERQLLVLVRISLVLPAAKLQMFRRTDCRSVFKVLSLFTERQSSTDFALVSTQSMY